MNKNIKKALSGALAASMAMAGSIVPALAASSEPTGEPAFGTSNNVDQPQAVKPHPTAPTLKPDHGMAEEWIGKDSEGIMQGGQFRAKVVKKLGRNAFYRIANNDVATNSGAYVVEFAVGDDGSKSNTGDEWHAIPKKYLENDYAQDSLFGAYVVENGAEGKPEVKFVKIDECQAGQDGTLYFAHATADGALVSGEVDEAIGEDHTLGTDFYIRVEDNLKNETENLEPDFGKADKWVSYDFVIAVTTTRNLHATIPMYVCMYGYRDSGNVVTPTKDQYVMKNYSSINYASDAYIKDVIKNTRYTTVVDKEHTYEYIHTIAYIEDKDTYVWFYSKPAVEDLQKAWAAAGSSVVPDAVEADYIHCFDKNGDGKVGDGKVGDEDGVENMVAASGQTGVYFDHKARTWSFKSLSEMVELQNGGIGTRESFMVDKNGVKVPGVDPNHPLAEALQHVVKVPASENENGDVVTGITFDFGTTPFVGMHTQSAKAKDVSLPINVSAIEAAPATWKIVEYGKTDIKAGEMGMKIAPDFANKNVSAIDLSTCSDALDITDRGWYVPAPKMSSDSTVDMTKPGELPLITMARMAGNKVNPVGCTPVVHVEYTISPREDIENPQINTDQAGEVGKTEDHLPETPETEARP